MEHLLLLAVFVLLALVAIAVVLLVVLANRLKEPTKKEADPNIERLAQLSRETKRRREETIKRVEALRETLHAGLKGRTP